MTKSLRDQQSITNSWQLINKAGRSNNAKAMIPTLRHLLVNNNIDLTDLIQK